MGYYAALGLSPDVAWGMLEIESAFRKTMRRHHPDVGGDGDIAAMDKARQAHRTLTDPDDRVAYDNLGPGDRWHKDPEVIAQYARDLRQEGLRRGLSPDEVEERVQIWNRSEQTRRQVEHAAEELMSSIHAFMGESEHPKPQRFAYYLDGTCRAPRSKQRERWAAVFAEAVRISGRPPMTMRIGFTRSHARVVQYRWGTVWFVPSSWKPSVLAAAVLVQQGKSDRTAGRIGPGA